MTKKKLTDKQEMFCKEYLVDLNATQAAIRAGYSETSAKEQGYENMTKPHIVDFIQELMDKRSQKVEITAENVLNDILETRNACKDMMILEGEFGEYIDNTALSGRNKNNEMLAKHLKLLTDKIELEVTKMPDIKLTK